MVAIQIRHVPDEVNNALHDEAVRRGTSLQAYLLHVLEREAGTARNRRLLVDWAASPLIGVEIMVDVTQLVRMEREGRDVTLSDSPESAEQQ